MGKPRWRKLVEEVYYKRYSDGRYLILPHHDSWPRPFKRRYTAFFGSSPSWEDKWRSSEASTIKEAKRLADEHRAENG